MRIHRAAPVLLGLVLSTISISPALAQPKPPKPKPVTEEQLKELATRVDEASKAAADSAAAMKALQDVQNQLSALKQELERQSTVQAGYQESRRKIEEYENRIGSMELQLAAMKVQQSGKGEIAGYEEGFFLQSPNRRFLLRANGLLQAAYASRIFTGELYGSGATTESESTYLVRRAQIELGGHVFCPKIGYHLTLDFGSVEPGPLLEGYVELLAHRLASLRLGKQRVPQGRQFLTHSAQQQFVDRSHVVDTFAPEWDLGGSLYGTLGQDIRLSYALGMFNGAGAGAATNDNIDFLYVARLLFEPLGALADGEGDFERTARPKLALGASVSYNLAKTDLALRQGIADPQQAGLANDVDRDNKVDNVAVTTVGLELAARWHGASVQSEYFYRHENPGAAAATRTFWGIYGQGGYLFLARPLHLEAAVRYGYWEPHYYGLERKTARPRIVHEVAGVLSALALHRILKAQLEYSHQWQRDVQGVDVNAHQIGLQLQGAF